MARNDGSEREPLASPRAATGDAARRLVCVGLARVGYTGPDRASERSWYIVSMRTGDMWTYRQSNWTTSGLTGFDVEAVDGGIGKIDESSDEAGAGYVVVDTGPWIFGKKVLLPAGVIRDVDLDSEKVYVDRSKDEIKNAPEFDEASYRETGYRDELGGDYRARRADRDLLQHK